jgi:nucleoside-diphosphate-sugar epimerase
MHKNSVVVFGSSGIIGSELVELLAPNHDVHCVSRRPPVLKCVAWHQVDLERPADFRGLPDRVDSVVYLAQSEYFRAFPERSIDVFQVNTGSLLRGLEYARRAKAKSFVYGSSGGVYGAGDSSMTEGIKVPALGGLGFYLSTKLCSEICVQNYSEFFHVVILRYFFVYGRNQRQDMLIPRLVQRVRSGAPIQLRGPDGIHVNPIHVSDAAVATCRAIELPLSATVNVAGPEVLSLRQIGDIIGNAAGCVPNYVIENGSVTGNLSGDITRMCDVLSAPKTRFVDGVKSML